MRDRLFRQHPLCVLCLQKTPQVIAASEIRDHIIPLAEGGTDTDDNVQALCQRCSDAKTQAEAHRGLRRW